jgi:uncharacterized protein
LKAVYLDSSAFVKLVVTEAQSTQLRAFLATHEARRVSSSLLRAEALRAVRHLGPDALAIAREGLRRVDLIAIDDRILDASGILEPRRLRTLDAIHLATALTLGDDLDTIVTYDDRIIAEAGSLGWPPSPHTDCTWIERLCGSGPLNGARPSSAEAHLSAVRALCEPRSGIRGVFAGVLGPLSGASPILALAPT